MADTLTERITKTPGVFGGKACVAGHRVRVMDVAVCHEHLGMSADEIVSAYPSLTLGDVHAALSYYFDNVDEIRADIRRDKELAEQLRTLFPSRLKEKLQSGSD